MLGAGRGRCVVGLCAFCVEERANNKWSFCVCFWGGACVCGTGVRCVYIQPFLQVMFYSYTLMPRAGCHTRSSTSRTDRR